MNKSKSIEETIKLLSKDKSMQSIFFSKIKTEDWFFPLKRAGFFEFDKFEELLSDGTSFGNGYWYPLDYIKQLCTQLGNNEIQNPQLENTILELFRSIELKNKNYFLGKSLFNALFELPFSLLTPHDVDLAVQSHVFGPGQSHLIGPPK